MRWMSEGRKRPRGVGVIMPSSTRRSRRSAVTPERTASSSPDSSSMTRILLAGRTNHCLASSRARWAAFRDLFVPLRVCRQRRYVSGERERLAGADPLVDHLPDLLIQLVLL